MELITSSQVIDLLKGTDLSEFSFTNNNITEELFIELPHGIRNVSFVNCHFDREFRLSASSNHTTQLLFKDCAFEKECELEGISGIIVFEQTTVHGDCNLNASHANLKLAACHLEGKTEIRGQYNELELYKSEVKKGTKSDNLVFKATVLGTCFIHECALKNALFIDSIFKGICMFHNVHMDSSLSRAVGNFRRCTFISDTSFSDIQCENGVDFSSVKFHGPVSFYSVVAAKGNSYFNEVHFEEKTSLDNSTFEYLTLRNCKFEAFVSFKSVRVDHFTNIKTSFGNGADFLDAHIRSGNRESFRMIKNEFLKINNQVDALHYRAKEMAAYEKELKEQKRYGEYVLVVFNRISNEHNLNWVRGVLFTLLTGIIFFCFYLLSLGALPFHWGFTGWQAFWDASGVTVKYFVRFFIVTHDIDFMHAYKPSAISFIIDFFSKIFIGYGMYQTIQAFRKHGKV